MKKSLMLFGGGILFIIGMILFPLPVPFGLPVMMLGLAIMFKASNKVKRIVIRLSDKNQHSRFLWKIVRVHRRLKK